MKHISDRKRYYRNEVSFRPVKKSKNRNNVLKNIMQWVLLIFIAMIFGYSVATFGVGTITVIGPSMSDTLKDNQVVLINKIIYKVSDIKRYDIIAFSNSNNTEYFDIKRVIGLPEETIQIKNGIIYVNDIALDDIPFDEVILSDGVATEKIVLGDDQYFVLGDNINNSEDSRYTNVGNISKTDIKGKVVYIISPKEEKGKVK